MWHSFRNAFWYREKYELEEKLHTFANIRLDDGEHASGL
jgi:hypothetical protein